MGRKGTEEGGDRGLERDGRIENREEKGRVDGKRIRKMG